MNRNLRALVILSISSLLCGACGTNSPRETGGPSTDAEDAIPLRILVVDDPMLSSAIERQWTARDGKVEIRPATSEQIAHLENPRLNADLVIYPSALLGVFASRDLITPFERDQLDDPAFNRPDLFSLQRNGEVSWGQKVYAVPFGSPQFTLWYRRDLFEQLELQPPTTWDEYAAAAVAVADRGRVGIEADVDWHAAVEPLSPGWAGKVLLARAAAYAKHRSQFSTLFDSRTMKPLIAGPPFIRAMKELVSVIGPDAELAATMTPSSAREMFLSGGCGMALSWPSAATESPSESRIELSFAELPGSSDVYNFRTEKWETRGEADSHHVTLTGIAGRLGSVTRECRRPGAATNALLFFCGDELGQEIAAQSEFTTLFRESQMRTAADWVDAGIDASSARLYAEVVRSAQSRSSWVSWVRIPGAQEYGAALDRAVHDSVTGNARPEEALTAAAEQWEQITEAHGREAQRRAYMLSVGRAL